MDQAAEVAPALAPDEALHLKRLSTILRIVADEKRLKMLYLLAGGELCVCKIMAALGISQALASHHLGVLRGAGLVSDRRDAQWVYYSLNASAIEELGRFLDLLATAVPARRNQTQAAVCNTPGDHSCR